MKKKLALLLMLLFLLPACAKNKPEGGYSLYFLAPPAGRGAALAAQERVLAEDADPGDLLAALLAGPEGEELTSPFPKGVTLQSWAWDEENPGNVVVVLSEQYTGLTDVSLTLADYAIVLTLSQLPQVESVEIQSTGYGAGYRSHEILTAEEAVLWDGLAGEEAEKEQIIGRSTP